MKIDWNKPLPHSHRWEKNVDSIMNPGTKITWPQLVAEFVVYWRCKFWSKYKFVKKGPGWYSNIATEVRILNYQANVICNYFPHPDETPMVVLAFKNYFRKSKQTNIGSYRKIRSVSENGRIRSNLTHAEKETVKGIWTELTLLLRSKPTVATSEPAVGLAVPSNGSFKSIYEKRRNKLSNLLKEESNG